MRLILRFFGILFSAGAVLFVVGAPEGIIGLFRRRGAEGKA